MVSSLYIETKFSGFSNKNFQHYSIYLLYRIVRFTHTEQPGLSENNPLCTPEVHK